MEMPKLPTPQAIIGFAMIYVAFVAFQRHVTQIPVVGKYLPGGNTSA
jgi:hypothetical protein